MNDKGISMKAQFRIMGESTHRKKVGKGIGRHVATVLCSKVVALLFEFSWLFHASVTATKVFWPL